MAQVSPHVQAFRDIYDSPKSRDGGQLTKEALDQISAIDYSKFSIEEMKVVQDANDLPDKIAVKIYKEWMHRQNELISNMRGNLAYTPDIPKQRLDQFINMLKCPTNDCMNDLIVHNILEKIATGGGFRSETEVPLIDAKKFDNGIIRFDQSTSGNESGTNVENLLDFNKVTFYYNKSTKDAFFIIGFPSFMKVRLTKYLLWGPPKFEGQKEQGGPQSWKLYASNDWDEIHSVNSTQIHFVESDNALAEPGAEAEYNVEPTDKYFRYFKFFSTGPNHCLKPGIVLSRIDFTGNVKLEKEVQ